MTDNAVVAMGADAYHADPCPTASLSNSVANVLLAKSPYHAWMAHPKLNPDYKSEESKRFDLGTAAHDLILEGGTAKVCVINPEDYRSKPTKANPEGNIPDGWTNNAIREARDTARANGLVPLLPWDHVTIKNMVDVARNFIDKSELCGVLMKGKPEQTVVWRDRGIWCRSRLDWLTDDLSIIIDYKTCDNAEPEAFIRQIGRMGYDLQSAFYQRGVDCATGKRPAFVFLAQEIEPPYACSLVGLSNAYQEIAVAKYLRAVDTWKECLETGEWSAYPTRICYAEPPVWVMKEHEEALILNPFDEEGK